MNFQQHDQQQQQQQEDGKKGAHVILLPLPLQGPINCFLKLAHLLSIPSDTNLLITFINAGFVNTRLHDLPSRLPNVRFRAFSDGISGDAPRQPPQFAEMVGNLEAEVISRLPDFTTGAAPATCLVVDGVFTLAGKKGMELGIPVVYFSTLSPCCLWASCALVPALLDAGQLPFTPGADLDEPVTVIPGSESALRRRDLPGVCRAQDMNIPYIQIILRECRELPAAQGHILNSFDELEGTALLSELHTIFPNLYNIGPVHSLFKSRQKTEQQVASCGSLWQEDKSCIAWLDAQPENSVIFVSFGSIAVLTDEQILEFWYGLVNSGVRFLWVQRLSSMDEIEDDEECRLQVTAEIMQGTKERGCIVKWAPQEEVLAHRSIGGFLTHSGWNSTLESIVEGVPMLCWPIGIDQLVISRFVEEVWKIGIDMKDTIDRVVIENMVRDLMVKRREEFSDKANVLSMLASEAVKKGGSSWCALDRLIEDIKLMRLEVPQ